MNPSCCRYAAAVLALVLLTLEVTAVHLFLDAPPAARLAADAVVALVLGGCVWAVLRSGAPTADCTPAECRRQSRAVRLHTDREPRARECGRPSGRV